MQTRKVVTLLVIAGFAATMLVGCGSKVTKENFDKIKVGMTKAEVVKILGEPTDSPSVGVGGLSAGATTWKDGDKTISVVFLNDKVSAPPAQTGL